MIQDILVRNFGAQFTSGALNSPTLAIKRRALVLTQAYREVRREIDRGLEAVLTLTRLMGSSTFTNGVKSCLRALEKEHVSLLARRQG